MTYQLDGHGGVLLDGACIPPMEGNAMYAAYLAWVDDGNTPEPAAGASPAELDARARAEVLPIRQLALDVLTGLGFECLATGHTAGASLCVAARLAVKDMGTLDLSGCADYEARRAAYKAAWAVISATFAPYPELRLQFNKALK
ncbi:MAG: hypothetical protein V4757_02170 [Pseudomonadota bacterium]